MKENDIYRWSYTEKKLEAMRKYCSSNELVYWATSRICICKKDTDGNLYLEDTYWGSSGGNKRPSPEDVELKLLGNFDELDKFTGDPNYYDPSDLVDISHSNSFGRKIYIKKGAKKSLKVVQEHIRKRISEKEYEAKSAARDVERYKEVLVGLNENNLDSVWI